MLMVGCPLPWRRKPGSQDGQEILVELLRRESFKRSLPDLTIGYFNTELDDANVNSPRAPLLPLPAD